MSSKCCQNLILATASESFSFLSDVEACRNKMVKTSGSSRPKTLAGREHKSVCRNEIETSRSVQFSRIFRAKVSSHKIWSSVSRLEMSDINFVNIDSVSSGQDSNRRTRPKRSSRMLGFEMKRSTSFCCSNISWVSWTHQDTSPTVRVDSAESPVSTRE